MSNLHAGVHWSRPTPEQLYTVLVVTVCAFGLGGVLRLVLGGGMPEVVGFACGVGAGMLAASAGASSARSGARGVGVAVLCAVVVGSLVHGLLAALG